MKGRRMRLVAGMAGLLAVAFAVLLALLWRYQSPVTSLADLPGQCARALVAMRADAAGGQARCAIRQWYLQQLTVIDALDGELARQGVGLDQRARCAYSIRHEARLEARARMPSHLALTLLRLRDLVTYGHPDGPSFESLLDPADLDGAYRRLIETAASTNARVDQSCELQLQPVPE